MSRETTWLGLTHSHMVTAIVASLVSVLICGSVSAQSISFEKFRYAPVYLAEDGNGAAYMGDVEVFRAGSNGPGAGSRAQFVTDGGDTRVGRHHLQIIKQGAAVGLERRGTIQVMKTRVPPPLRVPVYHLLDVRGNASVSLYNRAGWDESRRDGQFALFEDVSFVFKAGGTIVACLNPNFGGERCDNADVKAARVVADPFGAGEPAILIGSKNTDWLRKVETVFCAAGIGVEKLTVKLPIGFWGTNLSFADSAVAADESPPNTRCQKEAISLDYLKVREEGISVENTRLRAVVPVGVVGRAPPYMTAAQPDSKGRPRLVIHSKQAPSDSPSVAPQEVAQPYTLVVDAARMQTANLRTEPVLRYYVPFSPLKPDQYDVKWLESQCEFEGPAFGRVFRSSDNQFVEVRATAGTPGVFTFHQDNANQLNFDSGASLFFDLKFGGSSKHICGAASIDKKGRAFTAVKAVDEQVYRKRAIKLIARKLTDSIKLHFHLVELDQLRDVADGEVTLAPGTHVVAREVAQRGHGLFITLAAGQQGVDDVSLRVDGAPGPLGRKVIGGKVGFLLDWHGSGTGEIVIDIERKPPPPDRFLRLSFHRESPRHPVKPCIVSGDQNRCVTEDLLELRKGDRLEVVADAGAEIEIVSVSPSTDSSAKAFEVTGGIARIDYESVPAGTTDYELLLGLKKQPLPDRVTLWPQLQLGSRLLPLPGCRADPRGALATLLAAQPQHTRDGTVVEFKGDARVAPDASFDIGLANVSEPRCEALGRVALPAKTFRDAQAGTIRVTFGPGWVRAFVGFVDIRVPNDRDQERYLSEEAFKTLDDVAASDTHRRLYASTEIFAGAKNIAASSKAFETALEVRRKAEEHMEAAPFGSDAGTQSVDTALGRVKHAARDLDDRLDLVEIRSAYSFDCDPRGDTAALHRSALIFIVPSVNARSAGIRELSAGVLECRAAGSESVPVVVRFAVETTRGGSALDRRRMIRKAIESAVQRLSRPQQ